VPAVEALKAYLSNAIAKGSFNEGILTGMFPAEPPSGHAVVQMQMATTARMKPLRKACGRILGKSLIKAAKLLATEWDRGDNPLTLQQLTGQTATEYANVEYTQADFEAISSIYVDINPDVELDKEQKSASIIQEVSSGLLPVTDAIQALGRVQDAHLAMLEIAKDRMAQSDPATMAALSAEWFKRMGISMAQPQPPPSIPPPGGPMGAPAPGGPPPQGMPPGGMPPGMDPAMLAAMGAAPPPGPMQGGGGMAPPGQPPMDPQMLAALMQLVGQNGGGPPQGGP
jgi:hypothetical protein